VGEDVKVVGYGPGETHRDIAHQARQPWEGEAPGRYQPSSQLRWVSLGLIAAIHIAGFYALQHLNIHIVKPLPAPPLVVNLLPLDPPPPEPIALPTQKMVEKAPKPQRVVAPPPLVATPTAPTTIQITPKTEPEPPAPVKTEETKSPPSRAADTLVNLSTRLLSAEPPRYPIESRRRRETGTVVLMVVVDEEGRVSAISVATSSGADRLDKAALNAVRRWRWSPTMIDGRPSQVRGLVRIPFKLKDRQ
jgi:protein TonB